MPDSTPIRFAGPVEFRSWLRRNHRTAQAIVLRLAKRHASDSGITYGQALDEALCYGWIDGVRRRIDGDSFSIRFSPRKPRSIWSLVNVRHVERLIQAGRMTRPGLKAFEARKASRTGVYSFEQRTTTLAPALLKKLKADRRAWQYYQDEAPWYRRTSAFWVMSAKREETRVKRLQILIDCSVRGLRIPPLRR